MHQDLKRAIVNYMFDNAKEFQLVTATKTKFHQYIYSGTGYAFGGEEVSEFINMTDKLVKY